MFESDLNILLRVLIIAVLAGFLGASVLNIRIISARKATKAEAKQYEEGI